MVMHMLLGQIQGLPSRNKKETYYRISTSQLFWWHLGKVLPQTYRCSGHTGLCVLNLTSTSLHTHTKESQGVGREEGVWWWEQNMIETELKEISHKKQTQERGTNHQTSKVIPDFLTCVVASTFLKTTLTSQNKSKNISHSSLNGLLSFLFCFVLMLFWFSQSVVHPGYSFSSFRKADKSRKLEEGD